MKAVLFVLYLIAGPRYAHAHYPQAHKIARQTYCQSNPIGAASLVCDPAKAENTKPESSKEKEAPKRKRDDPQWWGVWVNGVIALISLCTLWVVLGQVRAVRDTERAFLVPVWQDFVHLTPESEGAEKHTFRVTFKNCGKTPAFVRGHQSNLILLDSMGLLASRPHYRPEVGYKGDPLVPDSTLQSEFYTLLEDDRGYEVVEFDYRSNGKILYAYGYVRYDDMYGRTHTTRYGLRYEAGATFSRYDHWLVDGPKAYNKYT